LFLACFFSNSPPLFFLYAELKFFFVCLCEISSRKKSLRIFCASLFIFLGNAQKRVENSNRKKKIVENVEELSPNLGQMLKRRFCVPIGKKKSK